MTNDGGQAFPVGEYGGMSLRDYFAARAMQGMVAVAAQRDGHPEQTVARAAYVVADAMIEARRR